MPNLAALEAERPRLMGNAEWQGNYQKTTALVESGYREMFTIVAERRQRAAHDNQRG